MYLYYIICRLFSEGYTSDIIYKILYPNLFSNKNIFWMMDFIFSTNMLNNKKYSFKYVEYLFLKRMRFYYNKLILIILIIYVCVVYPSGAIVFISYLFNFNTDNSILLVGYTFVSSYNGVAMISFSVNTNLSFGTVNVYS